MKLDLKSLKSTKANLNALKSGLKALEHYTLKILAIPAYPTSILESSKSLKFDLKS